MFEECLFYEEYVFCRSIYLRSPIDQINFYVEQFHALQIRVQGWRLHHNLGLGTRRLRGFPYPRREREHTTTSLSPRK